MRNLVAIAILMLFASCKQEPKAPRDYAVIHGNIKNVTDSISFRLYNPETSKSVIIDVDKNGNYRDTLKLDKPTMYNAVYNNIFVLYLKNDMDLELNFDSEKIQETISFKGNGEDENNFLKFKSKHVSRLFGEDYKAYLGLNAEDFNTTTDKFVSISIKKVAITLAEAMLLVFLVMFLFLQNWRYTIIPTIVVPMRVLPGSSGASSGLAVFGGSR